MAHFMLVLFVILTAKLLDANRKLSITYNEQCDTEACRAHPGQTNYANLVHVTAEGSNDTIHFLWSSIGAPTMLLARTSKEAKLKVNWSMLLPETQYGSISFVPGDVYHASSLTFTRLIEFNDWDDLARLDKSNVSMSTNLDVLQWRNATINEEEMSVVFNSSSVDGLPGNGTLIFDFMAFAKDGRFTQLPHLLHTENSTQFGVTMEKLHSHFPNSRFAVETMMMGTGDEQDKFHMQKFSSIDDEYTPATFTTFQIELPASPKGSFSQWKPVSYINTDRTMEYSVHVTAYMLETATAGDRMPHTSIAHAYFNPSLLTNQVAFLNLSFGITQDGFYRASNYTSWTATMGYGDPPKETMSLTVYIIISVSFGLPLVIMVFGGAGVCIHKNKKGQHSLIN